MKKALVVTLVLFVLPILAFFACCPDGDIDPYFDIQGVECNMIYHYPNGVEELPDGGYHRLVTPQDTVPFAKHSIGGYFKVRYYSDKSSKHTGFGEAYATSCPSSGEAGSQEGLDTLYLITNKALDLAHGANDTINDLISIDGTVNWDGIYSRGMTLKEFILQNKTIIQSQYISVRLNKEPVYKSESHSFTLILKLGNGEQYKAETNEIRFK